MTGKNFNDQNADKTDLRSEDVRDILGKPPGWIIRWGTGVLFLTVIIIITGSRFFSYPDIVRAPVIITKENPPSVLVARSSGKPEAIFQRDGAYVKQFDTLAVMENSARYADIFRLRDHIRIFNRIISTESEITGIAFPGDLVLGEVQPSYNNLSAALHDYRIFIRQDFYEKKIASLIGELNEYSIYRNNLERQRSLAEKDLQLAFAQFKRDSLLFTSNVTSIAEYERAQASFLNKQKAYETSNLNLSEAGITISRLERSIADARLEQEEKHQNLLTALHNAFRQLESSLAAWENSYLIVAPATGTLNYLAIWSSLQELTAGDPMFSIVPEDMGGLHTWIILPFRGAGKVRPGQRVNIKLDGYPYMEFGMVEGRVHSVSGAPVENGFPAVISLTNGAVTSFGRELEVIRQLPGIAEISTDELNLLERLFSPFRHLLKSRTLPDTKNYI
jgi:multidrug efflux pump subunit AcrA (membrane-fusion protein)